MEEQIFSFFNEKLSGEWTKLNIENYRRQIAYNKII